MNKSRPTNREILEVFDRHVMSTQTTLTRMEAQIGDLKDDVREMKDNQLTTGRVMALIAISISGTLGAIISIIQVMQ